MISINQSIKQQKFETCQRSSILWNLPSRRGSIHCHGVLGFWKLGSVVADSKRHDFFGHAQQHVRRHFFVSFLLGLMMKTKQGSSNSSWNGLLAVKWDSSQGLGPQESLRWRK